VVEVDTSAVTLSIDKCIVPLTPREVQVRDLMLTGQSYKEIGAALNISPRTVKFHAGTLYEKYGVSDRQMLTAKLSPGTVTRIARGRL